MTRKDYIALAQFMRDMRPVTAGLHGQERWHGMVIVLSDILKRDNPNFDAVKFRSACSVDPRGVMPLEMHEALRNEIVNYHLGKSEDE